jgi:hypothetical protein
MHRPGERTFAVPIAACAVAVCVAAERAQAGDFDQKELSLRLPAALSRFSPYGDVASVGGASAGSKWSSSVNPASSAWTPIPGNLHLSFSPQYSQVPFREGTRLHVAAEAITWQTDAYGTFQPALAQARTNKTTTRQGLDVRMDIDLVQIQWARKIAEDWAFGANFNFARSRTRFDLGPADVSDSRGETYGWRLGALRRISDGLLAGLVLDYAFSPTRTTLHDFLGLGVGDVRIRDTVHQFAIRPGISYEYRKDSAIYLDYQYGAFHDDTGRLQVHRFMLGVDHGFTTWLFGRGGVALDTEGNVSWTAGLGIYPCERVTFDIAYQNNMFPELEPEFGRSHTIVFSVGIAF